MKTPNLNRRLSLEAPQDVPDGAGGYSRIWMPMGDHWAEITTRAGRESSRGTATTALVPVRIVVRASPVGHSARPLPQQRFREEGRAYRLLAVTELDGAGHFLECFAEQEVVA